MQENQEILFAKTLEEVRRLAASQGSMVSEEQIQEAFEKLDLKEDQLALVHDYLQKKGIGIGEEIVNQDESLSKDEKDYLEEYKKELELLECFSDGEKEAFTLSAMAGEKDAQDKLIQIYLPRVLEIARLYSGQGVYLEDLVGEGNVALTMGVTMLGALENAKEADGMLIKMMMDAMEDYITENVSESEKDKKVLAKVNKVAEKARELAQEMRRKVTIEELTEESGMSQNAILEAYKLSGYAIEDIENGTGI